jgi:PAP2 superfamily
MPLLLVFILFVSSRLALAQQSPNEPYSANDNVGSYEFTPATIVVRWSQLAEDNAFAVDPATTDPFPSMRGWTMMYLAMHDALNAIAPKFRQYAFFGTERSAHPIAAAAQAAHDVMNYLYPSRQANNGAELAFWLRQIPDGHSKTNGINLGKASAAAIIHFRANDRMLVSGQYALQNPLEPGDYRFVPPLEFVYRPAFGDSIPFAIGSAQDFLPGPPPPLTSWAYALSVIEVKRFGELNSRFRSQDQTNFAAWWLEFNEFQWGRIMRQLTESRNLRLLDAVRMFALANMANTDATVAVWRAKNHYDFWRPFHAIRLANTDGNPLTEAEPEWVSEHVVPPLQEYPSAHAIQCEAVAETLRSVFRTDLVSFSTHSTTALPSNPVRKFDRLSTAAKECGESRIMAGFHYRFSVNVGAWMGNKVATKIVDTQLRRRDRRTTPDDQGADVQKAW